ncbi:MAG: hypothetical protein WD361_07705 [Gracilimonas sp.]
MKKSLFLLIIISLSTSYQEINAQQNDKEEVITAIEHLFDGMRANDSSKVASVFTRDAIMQTILQDQEGKTFLNNGDLAGFLKAVGTDKNEIWDEKITRYEIKIDGKLASAWTPYQFYRGEEFSHCGVNSFQLMNTDEGWKIFHIVDTRRKENCID